MNGIKSNGIYGEYIQIEIEQSPSFGLCDATPIFVTGASSVCVVSRLSLSVGTCLSDNHLLSVPLLPLSGCGI